MTISPLQGCGLEILGVESRDGGEWECEVGAVVGEDFMTRRDNIQLDVKSKKKTCPKNNL